MNFNFDRTRKLAPAQTDDWEGAADRAARVRARRESLQPALACGGGQEQIGDLALESTATPPAGAA